MTATPLTENLSGEFQDYSVDDRSSLLAIPKHHHNSQSNQQRSVGKAPTTPLLLLKPNGAPVFTTLDAKATM